MSTIFMTTFRYNETKITMRRSHGYQSTTRFVSQSMHSNGYIERDRFELRQDDSVRARDDDDSHDIEPMLDSSLICMSVAEDGPSIGFACYDEERNEILLEDVHAHDDVPSAVERFIEIARPNLVLVSNRIVCNTPFLELLTRPPTPLPSDTVGGAVPQGGQGLGGNIPPHSLPYRLLKTSAFEVRKCRAMILQNLRVTSLQQHEARERASRSSGPLRQHGSFPLQAIESSSCSFRPSCFNALASIIDFDSKAQIQAIGSLISFLKESLFRLEDGGVVSVNRIVQAKTTSYMLISASTLSALSIFATEHHPLIAKENPGKAKEGFSLYSLLDRTHSRGGRELMREWMMKPLIDVEAIQERQDAVELFMQPRLETTTGVLLNLLSKVGPADKIITRIQKCNNNPQDFAVLNRTMGAAVAISNAIQRDILPALSAHQDRSLSYIAKIFRRCNAQVLAAVQQEIIDVVDHELTQTNDVVIRRGFHPELDRMKDSYAVLGDLMEDAAAEINRRHPELELKMNVVFLPQIGFMVSLDRALVMSQAIKLPHDFMHVFNQDQQAYFKTTEMSVLDEDIGDLYCLIHDTQEIIVQDLEDRILDSEMEIRDSFRALSELDCIISFANCAVDNKYSRPKVLESTSNHIHIKQGRHPLQEIITENVYVPNDVCVDGEERMNVITGPNFSGKSCYLRQVGVLVYMAHLGSFLPCEAAEISIVEQIFARITSVETCSIPQSSFQEDLTQMATILNRCTSKSLVLIDEFGKGTSPASGIAILGAVIKKLADIGCKTVCTTHFLELFSMGIISDKKEGVKARRMALHLPDNEDDTATPLFKLEEGAASSSAGLICAAKAGVDEEILDRARQIIEALRKRETIEPWDVALPHQSILSEKGRRALGYFLSVDDWEKASEDQIRNLIQAISKLEQ